jgi:hypothetical protein
MTLARRLRAQLDPLYQPPPASIGAPIDFGDDPSDPTRTAVIVCHGMGQQVRFQTINDIVQIVRDEARRRGERVEDVVTRLVLFRDAGGDCIDQLGRAEFTLVGRDTPDRTVHVYEAYWAPLTEGKVVLRDVVWFLLEAGVNGIVAGIRGFRRLMFDVREALVGSVQPMIADAANRPQRWINIWSPLDWISGPVNYYDDPAAPFVENHEDPDARLPLVAHTHYWSNAFLARTLYDAL